MANSASWSVMAIRIPHRRVRASPQRTRPSRHRTAAYALLANACYTLGPVAELVLRRLLGDRLLPVGPLLFRQGLVFSVGLTLLPMLLAGAVWAVRVGAMLLG